MADQLIPPWLRISATEPGFDSNTAASPSIFTKSVRSVGRTGDKVVVGLSTQNASERETDPTLAFVKAHLGGRRGQANRVLYSPVGYRPRGAFSTLAVELLPNNTFANGTTAWASNNGAFTAISASDRRLRMLRVANNAATSPTVLCSSPTAAVLYAPYVARVFGSSGRGGMVWDMRIRDHSDSSITYATTPSSQTSPGMLTCAGVPYDTDPTVGIIDRASGKIAGDYMDVEYASLARCALVDNGTNLGLHSDDFTNTGAWGALTANGLSGVTANAATAPDGTATADSLIENSSASSHYRTQAVTVSSAAADYSFAIAVKAGARGFAQIVLTENTGATSALVFINLSTGALSTADVTPAANWSNPRAFVKSMGDGWYYVCLVARKTNAATSISERIGLASSLTVNSYTGDGTSNILVWRATPAPSSVPTRLVLTTTTASTGTNQTGSALHVKGLPESTSGLLLMSDWVGSGKQLCMVTQSLDSDAAGLGYLQLAYPPRVSPPDNDPIIVHEPMGRFVAVENRATWQERPGIVADFDYALIEALDE